MAGGIGYSWFEVEVVSTHVADRVVRFPDEAPTGGLASEGVTGGMTLLYPATGGLPNESVRSGHQDERERGGEEVLWLPASGVPREPAAKSGRVLRDEVKTGGYANEGLTGGEPREADI